MFTRFEEYAASRMLGKADAPPHSNGKLHFSQEWQRQLFGLALAVSKEGHFEWEDFRQQLIHSIGSWEQLDCSAQPPWDYYERFLEALLNVLQLQQLTSVGEVAKALDSQQAPAQRL